jgi:hypothetical protein
MKLKFAILATTLIINGCAMSSKIYTPEGKEGFSIDCSGTALSWGKCYEKAGSLCGARGYDVLGQSGEQGSTMSANQYGIYAGSVVSRNLLISCK